MNCPHCQRLLPDPSAAICPFCGMPLNAAAQEPYTGPTVMQGGANEPPRPSWDQPPGGDIARPTWNQPPAEQPPAYTPPIYNQPQTPSYGQPPTTPSYGQPPTTPSYGQPQTPSYGQPPQPAYGAPMGQPGTQSNYQAGYPAATNQPWTGQAQGQPQKKSRAGCVIGCLVALVLVVALVGGGVFFLKDRIGGITLGGATIGGTNTGPNGGTIIYQDALNGSTKSDWADDSNCAFGTGGYHIKAGFICYAPAPADQVGDAVTTVSVQQISGPITYAYGLVVRRVSAGNYYEFLIDANGKWIFDKSVAGKSTTIVDFTTNAAIKKGLNTVNTIAVQAQGSHFVFFVNGTQVGTADDSTFSKGSTGLAGNDGIEVVFTNLIVSNVK